MKQWLLFFLAAIGTHLHGFITEAAHFRDISSWIEKDTLVLLDIDDTLLIPTQMLGCDEWFMHRYKQHAQMGMNASDCLEKTLAEWEAIRHLTRMEIVEKETDAIVAHLQQQGTCVMGLTTQGVALATRTTQQLKGQSFDLSLTAPSPEDHCFAVQNHCVLYRKGVLFTSGMPKGVSLFALCDKIGLTPKRIVFINDKHSHLRDIEVTAEERGVEFIGLRYAFSDARKKAFNPIIAHYQFNHSTFNHILSDEEAKMLMGSY